MCPQILSSKRYFYSDKLNRYCKAFYFNNQIFMMSPKKFEKLDDLLTPINLQTWDLVAKFSTNAEPF